jgi:hypothetical protein
LNNGLATIDKNDFVLCQFTTNAGKKSQTSREERERKERKERGREGNGSKGEGTKAKKNEIIPPICLTKRDFWFRQFLFKVGNQVLRYWC